MSTSAPAAGADAFQALDDSHITRAQLKIMFISGMGFFTDAYDLFVIDIHETPRFAMAGGAADEAHSAILSATGATGEAPPAESKARHPQSVIQGYLTLLQSRRMFIWLIGTAGAWALLDFCYYGNTISTPEILKLLNPHASLLHNTLVQLAIFAIFAVPGYIVAILLLDKTGRRSIQVLGFGMMALMFLLIGIIPAVTKTALLFALLYGISYFFTEFGPNTTTFIYPAEIFPTQVRTTAHGISAGAGKLGAFVGAFLFPDMLASSLGVRGAEVIAGVVAALGLLLTIATLPEPRGKTLEELSDEALAPAAVRRGVQPAPRLGS